MVISILKLLNKSNMTHGTVQSRLILGGCVISNPILLGEVNVT